MSLTTDIAARLSGMEEVQAVALQISIQNYLDSLRAILDLFKHERDLDCIVVTATIPSSQIINILELLEIDMTGTWFVDCISSTMSGMRTDHKNVFIVESPTMLENILLKVEYLLKVSTKEHKVVYVDSINSLSIHNNSKILSEFLHIFLNTMRMRNTYSVILSIEEQKTDEISNMLQLMCDDILEFGPEGQ